MKFSKNTLCLLTFLVCVVGGSISCSLLGGSSPSKDDEAIANLEEGSGVEGENPDDGEELEGIESEESADSEEEFADSEEEFADSEEEFADSEGEFADSEEEFADSEEELRRLRRGIRRLRRGIRRLRRRIRRLRK